MRVRNLALACVAVVAMSVPARADVILTYHLSSFVPALPTSPITTNLPLGPQITGTLQIPQGEQRFIQIAITGNATPPTSVSGQNQLLWSAVDDYPAGGGTLGGSMSSFGFAMNYPAAIVSQPWLMVANTRNANSQVPYAVGHPNTYPNYNIGGTAITGLDLAGGLPASAGILAPTVIATLKIVGNAAGTGTITLSDLNPAPTAGGFGLQDDTNLDALIFAPAHNNFPLSIEVIAIPEPSSMCLAGLAVAGFGWRKLRRKATAAV